MIPSDPEPVIDLLEVLDPVGGFPTDIAVTVVVGWIAEPLH
jgi:hypothetical protein